MTGDGHLSMPRISNDGTNGTTKHTPIGEIAREVQKVADEIEAATSLTTEEEKEVEEPAKKKEKLENSDSDQDSDSSPSTSNA